MTGVLPLLLALVVGTWNGEWFPSGRAEHRAEAEVEAATVRAAGGMVREALARVDPTGSEDLVLCFNEIRDAETAGALCREIGRTNLSVAVVTGYRRRDRFDQQQDAILTTLPVAEANWSRWKVRRDTTPPRGYAHVDVVVEPAVTARVFAVHLKSNYGQTSDAIAFTNRLKRTRAVEQLVAQTRPVRNRASVPIVIAGDFNVDRASRAAADETIFRALDEAAFADAFAGVGAAARVTHPGHGRIPGQTFDYVFFRGFEPCGAPTVAPMPPAPGRPGRPLSDHAAVFVRLTPRR